MNLARVRLAPQQMRWLLNLWPPFLFNGIRVRHIAPDWRQVRVELKKWRLTSNYMGTQFGGNLFAMTDPFWMLMLMHAIPRGHVIWDKAAEIEFVKPGRRAVSATFALDERDIDIILAAAANGDKVLHWFENDLLDTSGELIARVRKQVYVRRKREGAPAV